MTTRNREAALGRPPSDCASCGEDVQQCPKSKRSCGHHCNHSWTHDRCCWCGEEFGEEPAR